jgi:hypothetical protein
MHEIMQLDIFLPALFFYCIFCACQPNDNSCLKFVIYIANLCHIKFPLHFFPYIDNIHVRLIFLRSSPHTQLDLFKVFGTICGSGINFCSIVLLAWRLDAREDSLELFARFGGILYFKSICYSKCKRKKFFFSL